MSGWVDLEVGSCGCTNEFLDRRANEKIEKFALHRNWRLAKFASRYLAIATSRQDACKKLVKVC